MGPSVRSEDTCICEPEGPYVNEIPNPCREKNPDEASNLNLTDMKTFFCSLFGHHFSVSKKVTSVIKEYKCVHCGKQVTTDVSGTLSLLTPQLKEINETLERIYQKRIRRLTHKQVA